MLIRPTFHKNSQKNSPYVACVEEMIKNILPKEILQVIAAGGAKGKKGIKELEELLPFLHHETEKEFPSPLTITLLCPANFTYGVGRYVSDMVSKWLIPGKFFVLPSACSLSFIFEADPEKPFFFYQVVVQVENERELAAVKTNLPRLFEEIKLKILAVSNARGEMKILKTRFPRGLKGQFENFMHPVFMPRNDEEILRNILLLANQLKYVKDMPQIVISFDAQRDNDMSFTIILLRLVDAKKGGSSLQDLLPRSHFHDFETKKVGTLRNRYHKEASIFKATLDKKPFLRKDYSLDLFKARQAIFTELTSSLGEMRDFNGGILSKQHEVLHELKETLLVEGQKDDFLLESFYYSINPPLMRSLFSSSLLKNLFLMLTQCEKHNFKDDLYAVVSRKEENYLLVMIGSPNGAYKEPLFSAVSQLKIPSSHLASTFVDVYDISCLGFILRPTDEEASRLFLEKIHETMAEWSSDILAKSL